MSNTSTGRQRIQDFELYFYVFLMNEERATQAFELNSNGTPSALYQLITYYLLLITHYFSPKGAVICYPFKWL